MGDIVDAGSYVSIEVVVILALIITYSAFKKEQRKRVQSRRLGCSTSRRLCVVSQTSWQLADTSCLRFLFEHGIQMSRFLV